MSKDNKKIFISYRRSASQYFARSVFMHLDRAGYDTFMDIKSINAGEFERIIKGQIAAREHFLAILAPGSLERLENPEDWLRKEIELALELKRNVIPILHGGFKFEEHGEKLTGKLEKLRTLNGLPVYDEYFDEAMERLCGRYLEKPVYVEITEITKEEESKAQEAIIEARKADQPTEDDLSAEEYFNKAWEASTLEEQIKYYTLAIEKKPDYRGAYNNRGIARHDLKQYESAIEDYNKAIDLDPRFAKAHSNRGNAYNYMKEYENAITDLDIAIALNPDNALSYNNRGNSYGGLKKFERAIEDYDKAIELDPRDGTVYINRGAIHEILEQYERAIGDFDKAIALDPNDVKAYSNRGATYDSLKLHERAIEDFDKAIVLDPQYAIAYNNRAHSYCNLGNHQQALIDIERALTLEPDEPTSHSTKAEVLHDTERFEEAVEWYDKALGLDPDYDNYPVKEWREQALAKKPREPKE